MWIKHEMVHYEMSDSRKAFKLEGSSEHVAHIWKKFDLFKAFLYIYFFFY